MPFKSREGSYVPQDASILFADVRGFAKLSEPQLITFIPKLLRIYERHLEILASGSVIVKNTWGDGLLLVTSDKRTLVQYAFHLRHETNTTDWASLGLPPDLCCRIALHQGTVYVGDDPFLHRTNCFGPNVTICARVEPVVNPGDIYCTEEFHNSSKTDLKQFKFEPLGQIALAKHFPERSLYRVLPSNEASKPVAGQGYQLKIDRPNFGLLQEKIVAELRSASQPVEVLISAFTLHFMKQLLVGAIQDYSIRRKIKCVRIKRIGKSTIKTLTSLGWLSANFESELNANYNSLKSDLEKHNISVVATEWQSLPEFHGAMVGDILHHGRWEIADGGQLNGNSAITLQNREADPVLFESYRQMMLTGNRSRGRRATL